MKVEGSWVIACTTRSIRHPIREHAGFVALQLSQKHPLVEFWSSLRDAQFAGQIDALLLNPNQQGRDVLLLCQQ